MAEQIQDSQIFTKARLPKTIEPVHYNLSLKPDLKKFTFEGDVQIEYRSVGSTASLEYISLNSCELDIKEGYIIGTDGDKLALKKVHYNKEWEVASLEFDKKPLANGTLSLSFTGILNDKLKGFYRTQFKIGEETVHAAITQFEAVDARRCLPCWDEPIFKATFSVTLTYPETVRVGNQDVEMVGLSNMPEIAASSEDGMRTVTFDKTPTMSTYLLAIVIGPFECIEGSDGRRPIRIFTTPGKKEQGQFALEVSSKSLPYYEDYFKVPYPLPKMDLIAIPDFSNGAMENWGLVTYRETALLVDPKVTTTARRQYVALVVAHELAHQWFGNLVTMEWWTHLWLNEGFATFMEFLCIDCLYPEFEIFNQFTSDYLGAALSLDSLHSSHPIEVPINHPSEIDEIFDSISYCKGASVLRMLHSYIGDDNFRKGMKDYLTKFAYKNTQTGDLWDCLELASGKPVRKLMTCWTSQMNYPWISATFNNDRSKLVLKQTRFTADGRAPDDDTAKWIVPILVTSSKNPNQPKDLGLFEDKTTEVSIDGLGDSWIKLNPGTIGIYRTAYSEELAARFRSAIVDKTLPAMDRLGLQNDSYALCKAGMLKTVEMLKLMEAYQGETEYTVWSTIGTATSGLNSILIDTDYIDNYHAYGKNLYSKIYDKLGWTPKEGEKGSDAMTRALVINQMVSFGHPEAIEEAKKRYKAHVSGSELILPDLRGAVYRVAANNGDDGDFDNLITIYRTSTMQEEQNRAAMALGFAKDPARLKRALDFAMSDEARNQDRPWFVMPIGMTNPPVAFQFLKDNKGSLIKMYSGSTLMQRVIKFTTENLIGAAYKKEVEQFFHENKFVGCERTIQQALERIELNSNWLARDGDDIRSFLSKA